MKPVIEELDRLDLPATVTFSGGVLSIVGSAASEKFVITADAVTISTEGQTFARADVARITLEAGGGYDLVKFKDATVDWRGLEYCLFDANRSQQSLSSFNGVTVGLSINRPMTDAYFAVRTDMGGRAEGGIIVDVGDPTIVGTPSVWAGMEDDDFNAILQKHDDDQGGSGLLRAGKTPTKGVLLKMDKLLLRRGHR
jgi:hypothetical protein